MKTLQNDIYLYGRNSHKNADFNVWMGFPGPESFALSSLGFLWMYKSLDETDDINVKAVYTDTYALPKQKPDMIGFSFTFDMDFINIFKMIENFDLQLYNRKEDDPLIFAGGPVVTANPKPYSKFFDFFIIGDGENLNLEVAKLCKLNSAKSKSEKLELLSKLEGVYVPSLEQKCVKKVTNSIDKCIYTPVISNKAFFKNTFIVEVERGCANKCGFCLASYLNLPIRFTQYQDIIDKIEMGLKYTDKIALLGAQITAHPKFKEICNYIYKQIEQGKKINMSISSMRVDAFSPEVVKTLVAAGQKNTTLAIEAGSETLRKLINKNLSEEQIFSAVDVAVKNGLKGFKFYGMLGLPTETYQDLDEMIMLAKKIKQKYKSFDISFGFSSFVPKPNTPFQWCGREDTKSLEKKVAYLKKELHKLGIKAQFSSIKWDYYQAVLSRGDESLCDYLVDVYKNNSTLGAFKNYAKNKINTDFFALNNYNYETKFPWDFIEIKPGKEFLIKESKRLLEDWCMV